MSRIRVAVLDSGIHPTHPHVGGLAAGTHILAVGESRDTLDRLGHGTAVASVIHYLAPEAEIVPVKIFGDQLATNLAIIIRAVDWCLQHDIQVINLSLGTTNEGHREAFEQVAERVASAGAVVVSAYSMKETLLLPGRLTGIVGVTADAEADDSGYSVLATEDKVVFGAQPFPRDIPGVPREVNLNGVSFAVARISAFIARSWSARTGNESWETVLTNLPQTAL
jgi:hypothetical protein